MTQCYSFKMEIYNLMGREKKKKASKQHELIPSNLRALLVGPSYSGKTNLLINFIAIPKYMDYDIVVIFTSTANQKIYQRLREAFDKCGESRRLVFTQDEAFFDDLEEDTQYLVVFDDVMLHKQLVIMHVFTHGRHRNMNCLYLAQNYNRIPAQLVRDNSNFLCLFSQCDRNLKKIYEDHCNNDVHSFQEFKRMCLECWQKEFNFLTINKTLSRRNGKYRNFDNNKIM